MHGVFLCACADSSALSVKTGPRTPLTRNRLLLRNAKDCAFETTECKGFDLGYRNLKYFAFDATI
jgi:hypothetical protein